MSIFNLHSNVLSDYRDFVRLFFTVSDDCARQFIERAPVQEARLSVSLSSCLLRVKGQKSGVRLWEMASIRELITSQLTGPRTLVGPPRLAGFPPPGPLPPLPDLPPAAALPRIAGRPPAGAPPKQGPATPNTASALHHGN